jgi:tetratricopeptide (TPR) repeat protein
MKLKKYQEALAPLEHYLSMTQRPSDRARACLSQGQAYLALQNYEKARESAGESLRSQKEGRTNAEARLLLGDIARAEGDFAGAAREYMVVSQIFADPEVTPEALFKGAAAFREAGEENKALQLERQLHKNYPEFKGAHSLNP